MGNSYLVLTSFCYLNALVFCLVCFFGCSSGSSRRSISVGVNHDGQGRDKVGIKPRFVVLEVPN